MAYYWALFADPALWLLTLASVAIIYHSNSRTRTAKRPSSSVQVIESPTESEAREALSPWKILIFPVVGSVVLILLFYFLKILRYFLIALITVSSFSSIAYTLYPVWFLLLEVAPYSDRYRTFRLPQRVANWIGMNRLPTSLPVSMLASLLFIVLWLCTSNWLVTNLIAACLAITAIASMALPSLFIATLMLSVFWAYDIFWVFISPLIFRSSVMETVAVGVAQLELPMLLKIPRLLLDASSLPSPGSDLYIPGFFGLFNYLQALIKRFGSPNFLMLGLGDIILPGFALNFFYRRDQLLEHEEEMRELANISSQESTQEFQPGNEIEDEESSNRVSRKAPSPNQPQTAKPRRLTYYFVAQMGYIFGLLLTFFMLIVLKRGQPALLYLVPCTLAPPIVLAWKRKQLGWLWRPLEDAQLQALEADASQVDEERGEISEGNLNEEDQGQIELDGDDGDHEVSLDRERAPRDLNL